MKLKQIYLIRKNSKENQIAEAYCHNNEWIEGFIENILNGDLKNYYKITDTNQKEEIEYFIKYAYPEEVNKLKMELNITNF